MSITYGERFFAWETVTAHRSAQFMLPIVMDQVHPRSVLDVGCGQGAWLAVWAELGVTEFLGLDGSHVHLKKLAIPRHSFRAVDLANSWHVNQRFDLVESLEVAEHLPATNGPEFVRCLCTYSDIVLFSAAQPGQGGVHHVNERDASYWAELFSEQGYAPFDCIRPLIARNRAIDPWYRFNSIIYANVVGEARLSPHARDSRVSNLSALDQYRSDIPWRLRRSILRLLPRAAVTFLSRLRYKLVLALLDTTMRSR